MCNRKVLTFSLIFRLIFKLIEKKIDKKHEKQFGNNECVEDLPALSLSDS